MSGQSNRVDKGLEEGGRATYISCGEIIILFKHASLWIITDGG